MQKSSPNKKANLQNKSLIRTWIVVSLLVVIGVVSLRQGALFSLIEGSTQVANIHDFDGDGIVDSLDIDDDNDGILDVDEGCMTCGDSSLINGDFEDGPFPSGFTQTNEDNVGGWETTAPDNKIEIWKTGFYSVPSHHGDYHVEINSSHHAALFQRLCTRPGSSFSWSVWHRGRSGTDVAVVKIGDDLATAPVQVTMTTGNTAWVEYSGTYMIPADQALTYFIFESVSTAGGNITVGNFIDHIVITEAIEGDCLDTDLDGQPDHVDLDSDNDGILDIIEAGGVDADGDGMVDDATDTDGDGLADVFDNDNTDGPNATSCTLGTDCDLSGSTSSLFDTNGDGTYNVDLDPDADGIPNYRDIDADGDGIVDNIEGQTSDAYASPTGYDDDNDGIDNAYDTDCQGGCTNTDGTTLDVTGVAIVPTNTDLTDYPDYLDTDSDNDGESDMIEAYDTDDDGIANTTPSNSDTDNDGLDDSFDTVILGGSSASNSSNTDQTAWSFPNDDPDQAGGEPDWRDTGGSFPVEWLSFEANQMGANAILEWATATETNTDFFGIERSTDGKAYTEIGTEPAQGNADQTTNYRFVDRNLPPSASQQLFYRLKQVDLDGAFSYSAVKELAIDATNQTANLRVAPNPANHQVTIQYSQQISQSLPLTVYTLSGQTVYEGAISNPNGKLSIDVSSWQAGTYLVKAAGQENQPVKLWVQH